MWLKVAILIVGVTLLNIPCGMWRVSLRRLSPMWFVAVHIAVPLVILFRHLLDLSAWFIPLSLIGAVGGHLIGGYLHARSLKL